MESNCASVSYFNIPYHSIRTTFRNPFGNPLQSSQLPYLRRKFLIAMITDVIPTTSLLYTEIGCMLVINMGRMYMWQSVNPNQHVFAVSDVGSPLFISWSRWWNILNITRVKWCPVYPYSQYISPGVFKLLLTSPPASLLIAEPIYTQKNQSGVEMKVYSF